MSRVGSEPRRPQVDLPQIDLRLRTVVQLDQASKMDEL